MGYAVVTLADDAIAWMMNDDGGGLRLIMGALIFVYLVVIGTVVALTALYVGTRDF